MIKQSFFTSIIVGIISLLVLAESASAGLMNGDFSTDLSNGWTITNWPVVWDAGIQVASFEPDPSWNAANSTLSQSFTVEPGLSTLSFDVLMKIKPATGPAETDIFTASLNGGMPFYTLSSTDLITAGVSSFAETFTYDMSSFIGTGQVKLEFNLAHDYMDVWDTTVLLDNVELTPVPSAVLLGMLGLCVAGVKLRKFA